MATFAHTRQFGNALYKLTFIYFFFTELLVRALVSIVYIG